MDRLKELIDILNKANKAYYTDSREIMSDKEYDKLYDELLNLEKETGIVLSNSPTISVGHDTLDSLKKFIHYTPLLSLDKTKDVDKLESFLEDRDGILSFKLDGLTIVLTYDEGELVQALTRGNGTQGEDVTHNARHFVNIPRKIPYKGLLSVRGEATISYSDFETINENLEEKYKNPRNLCSGTVRQLDSSVLAKRPVNFFAFAIMDSEKEFTLKSEQLSFLGDCGFTLANYSLVNSANVREEVEVYKAKIEGFDLPTDGLVLTLDDIAYSESLGTTSKFPRDSIAFKWQDQEETTTLLSIEWNTSRTGAINPIAIFKPVDLEGTEVKRASLHNVSILEELELGIGDTISVYKANMIIPQVAENLSRTGPVTPPTHCGVCESETTLKNENGVKTLYCTNPTCKAQVLKALSHYVSRNALNIEGLSEATLEKFLTKGYISDYSGIYELEQYKKEIIALDGFGEKSYKKIIDSIEKSKNVDLHQFIYGLGIVGIGSSNAKNLCNYMDNDIGKIKSASHEDITTIDGFGDIMANSVIAYFSNTENILLVDKVMGYLNINKKETMQDGDLSGLTFVVTGSVEAFKNRKELSEFIESKGGKVSTSVSKNTNYLINNDNESASSKNKNAKKHGVTILSEKEFINLFG